LRAKQETGHRFVELDALVLANGTTPLAHCHQVAIYRPRAQAAACCLWLLVLRACAASVSKDEASCFETALARLLTMRRGSVGLQ
jgi:hypothetical protein